MPFGYYDVYDHFWIVGGSTTQAWSSANQAYVLLTDPQYTNWVAAGNVATAIATEAELWETLAPVVPQLLSNIAGAQVYLEAFYKRTSYVRTGRAAFSFDATVIATGQVIKVTAPSGFSGSAFQYLLDGVEKFSVDHNGTPIMNGGIVNTSNFTINTALGVGGAAIGGVLLTLNGTTPNILLQDSTASAKSAYIKVDGNKLYIQELADTDGDKVTLDLATGAFTLPNTGLHLKDTDASHTLNIVPGSNLAANRILTLTTGDADRTVTISGDTTISQNYSTAGTPQFARLGVGTPAHASTPLTVAGACKATSVYTDGNDSTGIAGHVGRFLVAGGSAYVQSYNFTSSSYQPMIVEGSTVTLSISGTAAVTIDASRRVGIGTASPATSAMLEISSTTGAFLLPRMTTTQRDALTPLNGFMIYNSSLNKFQGYAGGAWVDLH